MQVFKVVPVLLLLIYTTASITIWPTHTICKNNNLDVKYRSCDPLQDLALSVDSCSYVPGIAINIQIATILRYTISQLSVDISLTLNGQRIPVYTKQLCEQNQPQFQFCGKKKGEYIYYEGPVSLNVEGIPQGEFNVTAQLFNGDHHTVICADFFIRNR
ncbi:lymphocyte antigen 86 [Candoia aspera]|uniref:lymphocyte antigen 86 n=1 Tax=Candoia aspera TaxID=51853 RepID=UPI002FD7DC3B